jgi:Type VI secretion system/phage-baseplate injector OB domain
MRIGPTLSPETGRVVEPREWHGLYPGTVVDDNFSAYQPGGAPNGRIRVRVDAVYGNTGEPEFIPDTALPWARPCFPVTGDKDGEAWVPEEGAAVWVTFVGGDPEKPVWLGGWFPNTSVPTEFSSSYGGAPTPGPKSRLIKTAGGQIFEMRWKAGQEHVYLKTAGGVTLDMIDAPGLGGPKFIVTTPAGRTLALDDKLQQAVLKTPTQSITIDDAGASINVVSPTQVQATVGPTSAVLTPATATVTSPTVNTVGTVAANISAPAVGITTAGLSLITGAAFFTLPAILTTAAFTVNAAILALNSAGVLTLTSVGVLSALATSVILGVAANALQLLNSNYHTNIFATHGHTVAGTVTTAPDNYAAAGGVPPPAPVLAAAMTANTKAS